MRNEPLQKVKSLAPLSYERLYAILLLRTNMRGGRPSMLCPKLFWQLFTATGSVKAYLLYKKVAPQGSQ